MKKNTVAIEGPHPEKRHRLYAFYHSDALNVTTHERTLQTMWCAPAVCFSGNTATGEFFSPCAVWLKFVPTDFIPVTIKFESHVSEWIEAGIDLAEKDSRKTFVPTLKIFSLGPGRYKPLYHMVWRRWLEWQKPSHEALLKKFSPAGAALDDLQTVFPEPMKALGDVTQQQVLDACKRLGLPVKLK